MVIFCCFSSGLFYNLTSITLEIFGLIFQSISLVLLIILFSHNLPDIPIAKILIFILMLIITIINIIFSIFIICWSSKGLIKTNKKNKGIYFTTSCYLLTLLNLILSIIGILKKYDFDLTIICVIYELVLILEILIWYILREKIFKGLHGPDPSKILENTFYDKYGRRVTIVQSFDDDIMDRQPNDIDSPKEN